MSIALNCPAFVALLSALKGSRFPAIRQQQTVPLSGDLHPQPEQNQRPQLGILRKRPAVCVAAEVAAASDDCDIWRQINDAGAAAAAETGA